MRRVAGIEGQQELSVAWNSENCQWAGKQPTDVADVHLV